MEIAIVSCPNGHPNASGQAFCGQCGVGLVTRCPNGHQTIPDQRFCPDCGVPLLVGTSTPLAAEQNPSARPDLDLSSPPAPTHPLVTGNGSVASASATGNWFRRQSSKIQTSISAALALLLVGIPFIVPPVPALFVALAGCFVAALAFEARSSRRRLFALLGAGLTGGIALATGILLDLAPPHEDDLTLSMIVSNVMLLFPFGFVIAWSVARRNRSGFWIGLLLAAPVTVGTQFWLGSTPALPWAFLAMWGIPTVLGCMVAWCVDLAATRMRLNSA